MKVYVTGVSGTGKTTVAEELEKRGIHTISVDETPGLCMWVDKQTRKKVGYNHPLDKEFIEGHEYICDEKKLENLMEEKEGTAVVLGVVSNQDNLLHLFDKIVLLKCEPEVFLDRIQKRTNNEFGKDETAQELLSNWYKKYEKEMQDKGAVSVDASRPIEEVVEEVSGVLKKG